MNCDQIEELLSDLIDDELSDNVRAGVEQHLELCGRCAAAYRQMKRTVRFVRANASTSIVPGTGGAWYADFTRAITNPASAAASTSKAREHLERAINDVIVIGGGMAGLATGALLAKRGLKTTVLEKGNQHGGRAYAYADKGFTLNYGAHAMYRPESGLLGEVMRHLERPVPACNYPEATKAYWALGDRWGSLGAKPHQALTSSLFPLTTKARLGPIMLALRGGNPDAVPVALTWGDWIDAHTSDALLRLWLRAFTVVNTYSARPDDLSARAVLRHIKENTFAKDYAGYMHGGWGTMFDAFIDVLRSNGGTLITGARVQRLEERDGRIAAAIVNGDRHEAGAFVCTLSPQEAPALAEDATPLRAEMSRWETLQDTRVIALDLGFSRRLRTDLTFAFDVERETYYSLHSEVTPDLAPEGSQLLQALAYLSSEDAASDVAVERRYQDLLAGLDRFFAGWRDAVVVERVLKNVRVTAARRTPGQYEPNGVPLRARSVANLYFANDARDLPRLLSLTSLAAALEVSETIAAECTQTSEPVREPVNV
jgi:phytoene dehydrogenase-like protein